MGKTEKDRQALRDKLQQLYDLLSDAYWQASTIEAKDRIRGVEQTIFDIITELNRQDLMEKTAVYKQLKTKFNASINRLNKLKDEIDDIIHTVELSTKIANALDQAISLAAKFFV